MNYRNSLYALALLALVVNTTGNAAETLEQRVQRLEDREAIRNVILDYGKYLDARDWDGFVNLFAREGEWIGGMGGRQGRDAIKKMMLETVGINSAGFNTNNLHLLSNDSITVNGDSATARTKWVFVVASDENRPQMVYVGHYDDEFVREDGEWKFRRRVAYGDIPAADPLKR